MTTCKKEADGIIFFSSRITCVNRKPQKTSKAVGNIENEHMKILITVNIIFEYYVDLGTFMDITLNKMQFSIQYKQHFQEQTFFLLLPKQIIIHGSTLLSLSRSPQIAFNGFEKLFMMITSVFYDMYSCCWWYLKYSS